VMDDRLATLRNFVRMGQAAQAEIDELVRRSSDPPAVHHLRRSVTACGMPGLPGDWPDGHRWSGEWPEVTCRRCVRTLCRCVLRDWIPNEDLPPTCPCFVEHDGKDYRWVCKDCGHERECHPPTSSAALP